jgi:type IV secretory pathway VirB4 component
MASGFGNSQDLVDLDDIKSDALILKDGGLRQVVMVGGINFSLQSEEEQNTLILSYQNFLNSVDFPLQIIIHSRKINIDHYLGELGARAKEETSPLLQNQITEYQEFVRQFVAENAIMEKTFLVVVPWYPVSLTSVSGGLLSSIPFFGKNKNAAAEEATAREARFKTDVEQLSKRTQQIMEGLAAMGLEAVVLKTDALIELFYNFYNPGTTERERTAASPSAPAAAAAPAPNASVLKNHV